MNAVFLDTVGLLALWDETDQWHEVASRAMARIQNDTIVAMTTTFVLLECGNAAARRPYRSAVDRLRLALYASGCLIQPTNEEWTAAWEGYLRNDGAGAGIVDQVSFIVMRRLGIRRVFTHDQHFVAAGFEVLF